MNTDGPFKKLLEFNLKISDPSLQLTNEKELKTLLDKISQTEFYHSSTFNESDLTVISKLNKWEMEFKIPFLDTLRMFLIHPASNSLFKNQYLGENVYSNLVETIKSGSDTHKILVLRILNNMFINPQNRSFMIKMRQDVLDNASVYLDSENANIRSAVISLLFK